MDIQMPIMDGYGATREIRRLEARTTRRAVPIIAMTAHAFEDHQKRCLDAGMDDFITKPVRREKLLAAVEKWILGRGDCSSEIEDRKNGKGHGAQPSTHKGP
jgi:CheY-like chemotaxis protein